MVWIKNEYMHIVKLYYKAPEVPKDNKISIKPTRRLLAKDIFKIPLTLEFMTNHPRVQEEACVQTVDTFCL